MSIINSKRKKPVQESNGKVMGPSGGDKQEYLSKDICTCKGLGIESYLTFQWNQVKSFVAGKKGKHGREWQKLSLEKTGGKWCRVSWFWQTTEGALRGFKQESHMMYKYDLMAFCKNILLLIMELIFSAFKQNILSV